MSDIYLCDACRDHHCHTCDPDVCEHGNNLCFEQAADYCGRCRTDIAWDNANVISIDSVRGK